MDLEPGCACLESRAVRLGFSTALIDLYQLGYAGKKGTQNPRPQLNLT